MAVTANIAEADVADVKVGQEARITFSAAGTTVAGHVTKVSQQSTTSNNVVLYPVTVTLDAAPEGTKVGQTTTVSITTGTVQNALTVSSSAITTTGTVSTVTVLQGTQTTVTPVVTGLKGSTGTEVKSGLSEGDVVVLPDATSGGAGGGGLPAFSRVGGLGAGPGR